MHTYDSMRQKHSRKVCQTIDTPIMIFDYFELGEVFFALGMMMIFGIFLSSMPLMFLSLFLVLGIGPLIRRRSKKGIFFHFPYRRFGMELPGLMNPRGGQKYSD